MIQKRRNYLMYGCKLIGVVKMHFWTICGVIRIISIGLMILLINRSVHFAHKG